MATTLSRLFLGLRTPAIRTGISFQRGHRYSLVFAKSAHTAVERQDVREGNYLEAGRSLEIQEEKLEEGLPFDSLKDKISYKTLKAITVKPMQFTHMSPVQEAVLSLLPEIAAPPKESEEGKDDPPRDLLVRAKTGTGKTLAFLVPAIEARLNALDAEGSRVVRDSGSTSDKRLEIRAKEKMAKTTIGALILSPTRELATQIASEAIRLTHHHEGFEVRLLTGGISKRMQMRDWSRGRLDIVVATTGRLRDLMQSEPRVVEALKGTRMLILDEADTMLDMGFREDIDAIAQELPPTSERQTLLFSATVNRNVEQIARRIMQKKHAYINTVTEDDSPVHAHIPQYHTVLPSATEQLPHVLRLIAHDQLTNPGHSKVIMFLPTTKMTQLYASFLNELAATILPAGRANKIYEIHSKKSMDSRVATSDRFRKDKSGACVLVTSDVSARGVDYPGITRVIQVGIPQSTEQYIHRVGRTGRKGGMNGRGDLVLLPWEVGFVTWQLGSVPMKPLTSNELQRQVTELSTKFDENPDAFFTEMEPDAPKSSRDHKSRSSPQRFKGPVGPRLAGLEEEIRELLATLDEETVRETVSSLLGYYVSKSTELRVQKSAIIEGCKDWSTQACGLARPPYFSEAFLKKVGAGSESGRSNSFGKSRQFGATRDRTDTQRNRWEGRGSVKGRDRGEDDRRPSWREDRRDPSEFRGFAKDNGSERFSRSFDKRPSKSSYGDRDEDSSWMFKRQSRSEDGEERPSRERRSFNSRR